MKMTISPIDLTIIVLYLIGILVIGLWSSRRAKKQTSESYFLADRNIFFHVFRRS